MVTFLIFLLLAYRSAGEEIEYDYEEESEETQCRYRSFGQRSKVLFRARSYNTSNQNAARNAFDAITEELFRISEKRSINQAGCSSNLGMG